MRFLADENVEWPVLHALRNAGHDVKAVGDDSSGVEDEEVARRAARESRFLITNDMDFGNLIVRQGLETHGVILLRFGAAPASDKAQALLSVIAQGEPFLEGAFVVVEPGRVRRRPLGVPTKA